MPPKATKTPTTGGKAPAGKAPAEKKEAGKKTAAPSGDKKKRTKSRKETYSSYIYKGEFTSLSPHLTTRFESRAWFSNEKFDLLECFTDFLHSSEASPSRHRYFQPCYVDSELFRQWLVKLTRDFFPLLVSNRIQISLSVLQLKHPSWLPTTRSPPSLLGKFRHRMSTRDPSHNLAN